MTGLILTDEVVAPERDVVMEERRMRTESDPAPSSTRRSTPRSSPIMPMACRSSAGATRSRRSTAHDALAYYRRFYTPENAILVVAGDVEPPEVERSRARNLRQDPGARRGAATPSAARAGAPRPTHREACRSKRSSSRHSSASISCPPLHRGNGRGGGARSARPSSRRRPDQPALSAAWCSSAEDRGRRRRLLLCRRARREPLLCLCDPAPRA